MLHFAYQNHHIQPGVYMGFRAVNDPIPYGERVFMMASDQKAIEDGDTPIKIRHFSERSKEDGQ